MKQKLKKGLAAFLVVAMVMPIFQSVSGSDEVVQASDNIETSEPAYGTEIALGDPTENVYTLQANALERGTKYKLIVTAESAPSVTVSNNGEDGNPYDGLTQYVKTKTMSETDTEGEFSVLFETAPVAFSNITLSISGAYTSAKLYEVSRIEISGVPEKNQLALNGTATLTATTYGVEATAVTWSSSNSEVATVVDGALTAKQVGKTEITATVTEGGATYEDYFELYVVNETLETSKYGLISDATSPADFTLQIPTGEDARVLQISDTQIMSMENIRGAGTENAILTGSGVQRWGTENALYENCNYYIDKTFDKLVESNTLPHLVVLIGDNTYGNFDDAGTMLDALIAKMDEKCNELGIYWTFVFGNHDKESDIGIENILRKYSNSERCLYAYKDVTGDSNMSVAIKQDGAFKQMVYLFDTNHTGSGEFKGNRVDEYAWMPSGIHDSQVDWFKSVAVNEAIKGVPSTVWMHIAFEEYKTVFETKYETESEDVYATNEDDLGERHGSISIWDDNTSADGTDFYRVLQEYNVVGAFCGHNHTNSFSIMTDDDIRLTFGMKTGTYDEYWQGMLGGTIATTTDAGLTVEHVDVVDDTVEDFDVAGPYGMDETTGRLTGMKTASMTAWWGSDLWTEIIDETDGGKAIKMTYNDNGDGANGQNFVVRVPDIKRGGVYRVTYELSSDTKIAARPEIKTGSKTTQGAVYYKNGTNTVEFTFISTVDAKRSDTAYPELAIWFWNMGDENASGESITIDDFTFEEIQAKSGDYNNDSVIDVRDVIRVKRHLGNTTNIAAAYTAEQTGDGVITNEDAAVLRYRMLRMKTGSVTENDDGTFEGLVGNISLLTPSQLSDVHGAGNVYGGTWSASIKFTELEQEDGNKVIHVTSSGSSYDVLYVKFDTPIRAGKQYTINMDITDLNGTQTTGTNWYYKICPPTSLGTSGVRKIDSPNAFFCENNTINFTATETSDYFYLMLLENGTSGLTFDFTIDNIKLTDLGYPSSNTVLSDDGSFEGSSGYISLYSSTEFDQSNLHADAKWQNQSSKQKIAFKKVDNEEGTALSIKTDNSASGKKWDLVYVKFDMPITTGTTYVITFDSVWTEGVTKPTAAGYAIIPDINYWVTDSTITGSGFTSKAWYDGSQTITFTAKTDQTSWYLVLVNQDEDDGNPFPLDMTIDNIQLSATAIKNVEGTFEGTTGNISLYSASEFAGSLHKEPAFACDNGNIKTYFRKVSTDNGSVIEIKNTNTTRLDYVYIGFKETLTANTTYKITYDAKWNGETQPTNRGWAIIPDTRNYVTTSTTNVSTNIKNFQSKNCFDGTVELTFTTAADLVDVTTEWYLVLFNQTSEVPLNFTIDNIVFTKVE